MASDKLTIVIDAVFRGKGSIESAGREMKRLDEETRKASEGTRYFKEQAAKHLAMAGAAFAAVGVAAKVVYDQLKQGAAMELARAQFANLATTVDTTADALLGKMREATKGMISDAELIASASQIISLGLAKNEDDVTRLANVVGFLGPEMLQNLILTFANDSTMRLDSLGLSVEGVKNKAAELKKEGFVGDAFDEAVLIGLEEKMKLFGDTSQTTAGKLAIFEANIANVKDAGRLWLVEALTPTVDALNTLISVSKEASSTIDGIVDASIAGATSAADIAAQYQKVTAQLNMAGGAAAFVTGTTDDLQRQQQKLVSALVDVATSGDEYVATMKEMGLVGSNMGQTSEATARAFYEGQTAIRAAEKALAGMAQTAVSADSIMLRYGQTTGTASAAIESAVLTMYEWNTTVQVQRSQALQAAEAMKRKAEAMREDEEATKASNEAMMGWYNSALGSSEAAFIVEENTGAMAASIDNANQQLYSMISASGTQTPESLALLGVALGVVSEDAANAALKSMLFTKGLEAIVAEATAGGPLTIEVIQGIQKEMGILLDTINDTPPLVDIEFETNAAAKRAEIEEIMAAARAAAGTYHIDFDISAGGQMPGGPGYQNGGGGPIATPYATGTGGDFVSVPPGYPNDSYYVRLQSGEDFMVRTPQDRANGNGTYTINIDARGAAPGVRNEIKRAVDEAMAAAGRSADTRMRG